MERVRRHRLAWAALALVLPVFGQTGEAPKFAVRSNLVFLPTRVQDKKGGTIYGLKPEEFVVEDNGVRQGVQIDEDPEFGVIIDLTTSAFGHHYRLYA